MNTTVPRKAPAKGPITRQQAADDLALTFAEADRESDGDSNAAHNACQARWAHLQMRVARLVVPR